MLDKGNCNAFFSGFLIKFYGVCTISIKGIPGTTAMNPTGAGAANPGSVAPTTTTLLTVAVTPGSNPTSTAHTVTANLSSIGGANNQPFFDDGTNGDLTPNDNVFSFNATVASGTTGGAKNLPATITETSPAARVGGATISLTVLSPTALSGSGTANPNLVLSGNTTILTVNVTPGTNPPSSEIVVTANLSAIGGSSSQSFSGSGNTFTYQATVPAGTTSGLKTLPVVISDAQGRLGNSSINLTVEQPPQPVDHIVISQIYGGNGGTYRSDYVELYNPTAQTVDSNGWSI